MQKKYLKRILLDFSRAPQTTTVFFLFSLTIIHFFSSVMRFRQSKIRAYSIFPNCNQFSRINVDIFTLNPKEICLEMYFPSSRNPYKCYRAAVLPSEKTENFYLFKITCINVLTYKCKSQICVIARLVYYLSEFKCD